MYGVLIVDDEVSICRLIKYLIPWESLGLTLVDVVYNGFAAMDIIRSGKVDILITDAKMPGCDGIELIKWCRENNMPVKSIVISGFRQFEYAHGAIRYGADAYILKPINQDELEGALKKIIDEKNSMENTEQLRRRLDKNRGSLKTYFGDTYLKPEPGMEEMVPEDPQAINEKYQTNFFDGIFRMLYFKLICGNDTGADREMLLDVVKNTAGEFYDGFGCEHIESRYRRGICCFVNYAREREGEFMTALDALYRQLSRRLEVYASVRLVIGIGQAQTQISQISRCRQTAIEAAAYRIKNPLKPLLEYDACDYVSVDPGRIFTKELQELTEKSIIGGSLNGLKDVIFKCRGNFRQIDGYSPAAVYEFIETFSEVVLGKLRELSMVDPAGENAIRERLADASDAAAGENELWRALDTYAQEIIHLFEASRDSGQNRPVQLARQYIGAHFCEAMSLEDVALAVHLNPRYLSKVFRQEAGLNYLDYVTAKRMEYAAELLRKTTLSVADISLKAGYQDVKYFTKLFRKKMGIRPSEYRRIYS